MKGSRFTEEEIIGILREQESGSKTADVCRKHGVSEATSYKWKAKFGAWRCPMRAVFGNLRRRTPG
jgi:putative transposase